MDLPHNHKLQLLQPGVFGFKLTAVGKDREDVIAAALRLSQGAKELSCRFENGADSASAALEQAGFRKRSERIEYRAPLSALPGEEGTPLRWQAMPDKSDASFRRAAETLTRCGQGDPDWSPDDDAFELLKMYLADEVLRGEASCVQTGFFEGLEAAMIVAQVNPKSGWSRITYMGVIPPMRGKGLGKWVHRHGFAMMREQGGVTYHGGTLASNSVMRRLFDSHGCEAFRNMEEWVWKT